MPTSDIWLPLLIAVLGLTGTITGVVFTQRRSDRREDARWARELEREAERQSREDVGRIFDHRRDAYFDYLADTTAMYAAHSQWDYTYGGDPPEDTLEGLWQKLTAVKVYGTPEATRIATALFTWLRVDMFGSTDSERDNYPEAFDRLTNEFVMVTRQDLGIEARTRGSLPLG